MFAVHDEDWCGDPVHMGQGRQLVQQLSIVARIAVLADCGSGETRLHVAIEGQKT